MGLLTFFSRFSSQKHHYLPVFAQQATYLFQASGALCEMLETMDVSEWKRYEKEVKACEVQGDALLTEFYEHLYETILTSVRRSDIQNIAMNIDEFLDNINDCSKSVLLYRPKRIDPHLHDLAQYIYAEADAIRKLVSFLGDLKGNYMHIAVQCDRITELEHAADDTYAEYIDYIFTNEKDAIELMKYKNIAETLESATDAAKRISDNVRKFILRYTD